jgi:nitrile hydratase accessory protein
MTTRGADAKVGQMDGEAALPRKNGELVFEAPWESRAFGLAVAMSDRDQYAWEEFRQRLIARIGAADASGDPSTYYERWLAAFESLLVERGFVNPDELDRRTAEYASGARDDDDHDHEDGESMSH